MRRTVCSGGERTAVSSPRASWMSAARPVAYMSHGTFQAATASGVEEETYDVGLCRTERFIRYVPVQFLMQPIDLA